MTERSDFDISRMSATLSLTGYVLIPTDIFTGRCLGIGCLKIVVIGIDLYSKLRYLGSASFIREVLSAVGAGPVFDYTGCHTGCVNFSMMNLVLVCDRGDILLFPSLGFCPRCLKSCSVGSPSVYGTGCGSLDSAACLNLFGFGTAIAVCAGMCCGTNPLVRLLSPSVAYAPFVTKRGNILEIHFLGNRPFYAIEYCRIGSSSCYLTGSGNLDRGGNRLAISVSGLFVCIVVFTNTFSLAFFA